MTKIECYTQWMERIAADQSHGYSQANRWGPDYDCSSLVISALEHAGIPAKQKGATYTGNMYPVLTALGFKNVTASVQLGAGSGLQRGDILLNVKSHTAVYAGNGKIVHARGRSYGSAASGDQGQEIAVTKYYNYPWNYVLRYTESGQVGHTVAKTGIVGTCTVELDQMVAGATGEQVKTLQILLNAKGYLGADGKKLDVDGELGENTGHAIAAMQRANGFPEGTYWGTVAGKTWSTLLKGTP